MVLTFGDTLARWRNVLDIDQGRTKARGLSILTPNIFHLMLAI